MEGRRLGGMDIGFWRWVAYGLWAVSAILIGLCVPKFIKSRKAPYYILRKRALRQATNCVGAAAAALALGVALWIASPHLAALVAGLPAMTTPTATAASTPTPTPGRAAQPTPSPTRRPAATASPTPALTPTAAPTSTPEAGPRITLEFVRRESEDGRLLPPGTEFPPGRYWIYVLFRYSGMQDGLATTFAWYKDAAPLDFCSDVWAWGSGERNWGESGRKPYGCRLPEGWQPGHYEVHVLVEEQPQFIATFVIAE